MKQQFSPWRKGLFCSLTLLFSFLSANAQMHCVATNDCGVPDAQPFLIKGENYRLPPSFTGSKEAMTCNFGGTVIYAFNQLDIEAHYQLEVVYLADNERKQRIIVDGNELQAPVVLEAGKEQRYMIDLPKKAFAYGQLVLVFEALKGDNTLVSAVNLYSSNPDKPVPFEGQKKMDLIRTQTYQVDTTVCAEEVLPVYTVAPEQVAGVYQPRLSLNGIWAFNEKPEEDFYRTKVKGEGWQPIVVPGQWSMQGFKVDSAAWGGYQTSFVLPDDWKTKRVKLRFDGVSSEAVVYLNGQEAGRHMGGMTPFEIDLTSQLLQGENVLSLKVRSESTADMLGSLTQYAAHQLGGITRKVTLTALPEVHVSDMRVVTDFDEDYEDADLKVFVVVSNEGKTSCKKLHLHLNLEGQSTSFQQSIAEIKAGESWRGWIGGKVCSPEQWDNEHPRLYTMKLSLSSGSAAVEQMSKRIGFREIQLEGNRLLVNGRPVKLRGVCRHEMHPLTGRVLTPDEERKDVELYRAANCNFIRTSHYPPCEELLEVCDELGMFVEVEAPVCWIGHHANQNWERLDYRDPQYYQYVLQANMEMIQFYRNHPSVLFWSMANESYWNKEFAQVEEYVKKADPTRPHTFHDQAYGGFNNQGSTAPIANIHYPGPDGYKVAARSDRPMVYGEYCHLNVYNRSETETDPGVRSDWALALGPTWENMYKTPGVLGGSIWSGIDDIFQLPDGNAVGYGPWGPIDGWRRPKPEYWDMKNVYSPVRVLTTSLSPSQQLSVEVENRYTFTDFNELQIRWKYGEEQGCASMDCAPGERATMSIPIAAPEKSDGLDLTFVDPRGFVVCEYRIPVGKQLQNIRESLPLSTTKCKTKKDRFIVSGKDFSCEVSRTTGQLLSVTKEGKEILCGGPWLMALPLTGGGCFPNHNANTPVFNEVCKDWQPSAVTAERNGQSVVIKVSGAYSGFEGYYNMYINANGEMTIEYQFDTKAALNPRQWGLVFEAPTDFDRAFWRRDGLWTVYPDDHISRTVGEAPLFYPGLPEQLNPRVKPTWSWNCDFNQLGCNDFRATRRNIWLAGLKNVSGARVLVVSDGQQHWRSWLEQDRIRFLVADFVSPGNEMFLGSHYAPFRRPLKVGDKIEGKIRLVIEVPTER